jgi:pimeloyl-ACP methyl ester carboxylesterase
MTVTARRALTILLLAGVALLGASGAAAQAQTWKHCYGDLDCTRVTVPLDRSGNVPGSVPLRVARADFAGGDAPTMMYLSGGPGGAGVLEMIDVMLTVPSLLDRYRVIGFDQRGTGASGLLRCPSMERDGRLRSSGAAARCAARLGARRAFYTTPDSVKDMEAIRRRVGAKKLTLFGISYGTELALAYARAYPARVDRLVLDSTVDPDESDPFGLAGFRAMGPTLRSLCPAGCRGLSADPAADLSSLVAALRLKPLAGDVYTPKGERKRRAVTPVAIADLMYDADYAPAMRAAIPTAVRAALAGDAAPMLRLLRLSAGFAIPSDPREFSAARYATVCEETPLPWVRGTPIAARTGVVREHALALPSGAFFPFDAQVAYADEIDLCRDWPDPGQPPAPKGAPYPDVPVLFLQGLEDLRTPPEVSAHLATVFPRAQRTVVPGVGHAIVGADPSGCGIRQLKRFLRGGRVRARCPRVDTFVPETGVPPASFGAVTPTAGLPARVGRTVASLDATLDDLDLAVSPVTDMSRGGGLRGGFWRLDGRGRLHLRSVVVVPGVRVSGDERHDGSLALRVRGSSAARGSVSVSARGRVAGRLGGRRVRARLHNRPPKPFGILASAGAARVATVASPPPAHP